ncbi:Holliday junction branch migration protein RuvA [Kocuria atrinae]|uniref:Holliday junction branch migration protein RuvA n=1 Tax=Kocuria atrinae TaxID=592377 RepID=UPI00030D679B|nr:Holliday junction branch migration protein RuvA [Kocuria atrinae]
MHLHTAYIARKDEAPLLFGFAGADEKEVFTVMLGVSGVGPRTALAAVSVLGPDETRRAIATGDDKAFTAVPGIGPKSARRIVLELADKLVLPEPKESPAAQPQMQVWREQVMDALVGLGWSEKDATRGIDDAWRPSPNWQTRATCRRFCARCCPGWERPRARATRVAEDGPDGLRRTRFRAR